MPHQAIDDAGRVIELPSAPRRIVSLVPSATELVCALGAGDRLVGVTRYCTDPPGVVAALPRVGGTKNPRCDEIIALQPDLVVISSEENRREDFDRLVSAGVPLFVGHATTVAGAGRSVERLGALLRAEEPAGVLAREIDGARTEVCAVVNRRSRVFCPIWRSPWMAFNRATYAHDVLWCAGGENLCAAAGECYPTVSLADIAGLEPEVILLPDEPYRFRQRDIECLGALADTPAWRERRIHFVHGQSLLWYGPRTPGALRYFHAILRGSQPA